MHEARHGGCPRARGQVRWLHSSGTGGPFPARVGSSGSPCAAHTHTRARAHARARPRCTLQHTFPLHCTSTTTAHFCTCKLTGAHRSGASGRGGRRRARHGRARPKSWHREPQRGLQPPEQEASKRFAMVLQIVDKSAAARALAVELRRAACLDHALKAAHAWPQHARMLERRAGAHGAAASSGCHAA